MASDVGLRGVYVAAVTPFEAGGAVARSALEGLVHGFLDAGAAGIVALGTTAEATALEPSEKQAVIDVCSTRWTSAWKKARSWPSWAPMAQVRRQHFARSPAQFSALEDLHFYNTPS